jgi:hypothetical protein
MNEDARRSDIGNGEDRQLPVERSKRTGFLVDETHELES